MTTIYKSKSKISETFLCGCGVPDIFIEYLPSLIQQPIQFYSCFISYSSRDTKFAERLHADLQSKGVRCWFAPEDLKIGARIRTGTDRAIRGHEKLSFILSRNSLASDRVEQEAETAMEQKRERQETVLFPIRLDEAILAETAGWAVHIKRTTRNIGNLEAPGLSKGVAAVVKRFEGRKRLKQLAKKARVGLELADRALHYVKLLLPS